MTNRAGEYEVDAVAGLARVRPREGLLQRFASTCEFEAALAKLHQKLAVSTVVLERHEDGRIALMGAVAEVMDFLESQGIPRAAMAALQAITAALVDADRGITNPIFQGDTKVGAPPKPVLQADFEEQLAVIMECCVRHLRSQGHRPFLQPASALAAKLVNDSVLPVKVTSTRMRELRERVQQLPPGSYGRRTYDLLLDSEMAKLAPLEYAKAWTRSDLVTTGR